MLTNQPSIVTRAVALPVVFAFLLIAGSWSKPAAAAYQISLGWSNQVDNDGDGFFSSMTFTWAFTTDGPAVDVFDAILVKASADAQYFILAESPVHTLSPGNSTQFNVNIAGGPHDTYDYLIAIVDAADGDTIIAYIDETGAPPLNDHPEEFATEDGLNPPVITSSLFATGAVGKGFSYTITADGDSPITFTADPLPPGLVLNGSVITGTPGQTGTYDVTLTAANGIPFDDQQILTIVIQDTAGTPVISPNGGSFSGSIDVTLSTATPGAQIRYTIDGTVPDSSTGILYSGQFQITDTATLQAIAFSGGFADSDIASATFVARAAQTVDFTAIPSKTFGDPPFTASATASSGLPATISIVSGPATIAGSIVTITGAGTILIRASQAGDNVYAPAPDVDQNIVVAKANQTVNFGTIANKTVLDSPFTISATSTSNLPVAFSVVTGPASINGNSVTLTAGGTVTIRASQAGNTNYNPAPDVDRTFTVTEGHAPVFTSPPTATPNPGYVTLPIAFTAVTSDQENDPVSITWNFGDQATAAGPSVSHTYTTPGTYTVTVTASDGSLVNTQSFNVTVSALTNALVAKGTVKFTFNKANKDSFALSGTIPLPANLVLNGKTLNLIIAQYTQTGIPFVKTTATNGAATLKISAKLDKATGGVLPGQVPKFSLAIKNQNLFDGFKSAGFVNADIANKSVLLTTLMIIDGKPYAAKKTFIYSAKIGKSGAGK